MYSIFFGGRTDNENNDFFLSHLLLNSAT
uniref:Uncharacterized protein n=1 Tax=Lepeophtheirus salmonis TaxID=72036 RepID=A0A0K2T4B3_LEPSM